MGQNHETGEADPALRELQQETVRLTGLAVNYSAAPGILGLPQGQERPLCGGGDSYMFNGSKSLKVNQQIFPHCCDK